MLITDERVAEKIRELDDKIACNKKEYEEKEKNLLKIIDEQKKELDEREKALEAQKLKQEEKEKELANEEMRVKKQCETAVADEVARIKADERKIREKEKEEVYSEWEADKDKQREELEKYICIQRKKIDSELEKAHFERMEAEETKLKRIHEADFEIEEKRAELSKEYAKKLEAYSKKKSEYERLNQELLDQQADLDADTEYVNELKRKYSQYSEKEVLKLKQQIHHYEEQIEVFTDRIKELSKRNTQMQSNLLDDNGASLLVRIEELQNQLNEAMKKNDELANMPSEEEIERLRANSKELEILRTVVDDEKQKRLEAEAKISAYAMSTRELENARVAAAALESLNNQLQIKLKYISEQYKSTQESKFRVLLDIDKEIDAQGIFNRKRLNIGWMDN